MRIVFLDQFSDLGGAQLCLRDVLEEVSRLGWQAEVMAPGAGPLLDFARERGFAAQRLPAHPLRQRPQDRCGCLRFGVDMARSARTLRRVLRDVRQISFTSTDRAYYRRCPGSAYRFCFTPTVL